MHAEVAVVGGGPVGLALGCALRQLGVDVLVLERHADVRGVRTQARASHVHGRVLELLGPLTGVDPHPSSRGPTAGPSSRGPTPGGFGLRGRPTTGAVIRDAGRVLVDLRCDEVPSRYPYSLAVPQPEVEAALEARFAALGGELVRGAEVIGVRLGDDAVTLTLAGGGEVSAGWAVGCDGANSVVREQLGVPFDGVTREAPLALADYDTEPEHRLDQAQLHCGPNGVVFRVPLRDGERVVVDLDVPPGDAVTAPDVAALAQARIGALPLGWPRWASMFRLHRRIARRLRVGRALLAGDAAHLHSPLGGHGMNTGLLDALHLGWRLAAVVRGVAADGILDRWADERRGAAAGSVDEAWLGSRILLARHPAAAAARRLAIGGSARVPYVARRLAAWSVALDADATSAFARRFGAAPGAVGSRAVGVDTTGADGVEPGDLALVGFGPDPHLYAALPGHADRLAETFGAPVSAVRLDPHAWRAAPGTVALVRPDGIVAYRGGVAGVGSALGALLAGG